MSRDYGARTTRVQNPRSTIAGKKPEFLQAGVPAFNLVDRRLWVGDLGDDAIPVITRPEPFDEEKGYITHDIVFYEDNIRVARRDKLPGEPFVPGDWTQVTDRGRTFLGEPFATAVAFEGGVSKAGATTVDIAYGLGVVVTHTEDTTDPTITLVFWDDVTATLAPPATGLWQYVGITSGGAVTSGALSDLTPDLRRSIIVLGVVRWSGAGSIEDVYRTAYQGGGTAENFVDLYEAAGGAFRSRGLDVTEWGDLRLTLTAGEVFALSVNVTNDLLDPNRTVLAADLEAFSFDIVSRDDVVTAATQDLDPSVYDNGGSVTAVPAGMATIQYVLAAPDLSKFYVQIGQTLYSGVASAAGAIEADWAALEGTYSPPMIALAAICVEEGVLDLSGAIIVPAQRRGLDPFVDRADFDDSPFLYLDGSRPMEGDLDLGPYSLVGGELDGGTTSTRDTLIRTRRSEVTGEVPATTVAGEDGELFVNLKDRKIFARTATGTMQAVTTPIREHDATVTYAIGDICVEGGLLYIATAANGPGAFDLADWSALSAELTDVIVTEPLAPGANTITPQAATVEGLVITPNPSQAAVLFDAGGAIVKADGFANYRFGPANFKWVQSPHPFASVGQAAGYSGGQYIRADASSGSGKAYGIVEEIIDADTVVLRTAGRIEGLDAASFVSGTITPGTLYYASTTPGLLTAVQPTSPDRVDPVLLADSSTSGIVVVDSGVSDANDRVNKAGDSMQGPLVMEDTRIVLNDTSQGSNTKRWRIDNDSAEMRLQPETDAGAVLSGSLDLTRSSTGLTDATLDPAASGTPTSAPSSKSLINRERGDARYAVLSGDNTLAGTQTISPGLVVNGAATVNGTLDVTGQSDLAAVVATGGFSGTTALLAAAGGTSLDLKRLDASHPLLRFLDASDVEEGLLEYDVVNSLLRLVLRAAGADQAELQLLADDLRALNLTNTPPEATSIINRERGDLRYASKTDFDNTWRVAADARWRDDGTDPGGSWFQPAQFMYVYKWDQVGSSCNFNQADDSGGTNSIIVARGGADNDPITLGGPVSPDKWYQWTGPIAGGAYREFW